MTRFKKKYRRIVLLVTVLYDTCSICRRKATLNYFAENMLSDFHHIYLTRSLGFLKLLGQKLQQLANFGSVSSSTALSLISLILSLSAADWARIRSDTEASSPGSFASSAACSSVKVMISKPLLFDVFCPASSSSSSTTS